MKIDALKKISLYWIVCHCLCLLAFVPGVNAQVETLPFCEDFVAGGPIDLGRWARGGDANAGSFPMQDVNDLSIPADIYGRYVNVVTLDGDNDPALLIGDGGGDGSDYLYAEALLPFARGNNLVCQFQTWGDPADPGTVNGVPLPWTFSGNVPYGPWHCDDNGSDVNGPADLAQSHILGGVGDRGGPNRFKFVNVCLWQTGPTIETAFRDAFDLATTRANSTWIRFWLGNTDGAYGEWSVDAGATWTPFRNTAGADIDTRDIGATGDAATDPAYVAFGATCCGGFRFYDNIFVGDDSNPLPAPADILVGQTCADSGPPPNRVRRSELYQ
jgi:hypothetical protein